MTKTTAPVAPVPFFDDTRDINMKLNTEEKPWTPHKGDDSPRTLFGLVIDRGTYTSDYGDGNELHDTLRLLDSEANIEWSVIAFHGWLQNEITRKQPRVGDFVAIAYLGTKPAKRAGESEANVYKLIVERNPSITEILEAPEPVKPMGDDDIPF